MPNNNHCKTCIHCIERKIVGYVGLSCTCCLPTEWGGIPEPILPGEHTGPGTGECDRYERAE